MYAQCAISLIERATVAATAAAAKVEQSSERLAYTILSRGQTSTAHKHTGTHTRSLTQTRQESNKENTQNMHAGSENEAKRRRVVNSPPAPTPAHEEKAANVAAACFYFNSLSLPFFCLLFLLFLPYRTILMFAAFASFTDGWCGWIY